MRQLFFLYRRNGIYYAQNTQTGKQVSLRTRDEAAAKALLHSKNEAARQPILNRQIALAYLSATDPDALRRTWKFVMDEMIALKRGATRHRYTVAWIDSAFRLIENLPLLETNAEQLLRILRSGTVSTNHYLRRMHNFALEMNWLPKAIVPRHLWPKIVYKVKRAISRHEHETILGTEKNPEYRAYYALAWHTGAAQTDLAVLTAEDVDWEQKTIGLSKRRSLSSIPGGECAGSLYWPLHGAVVRNRAFHKNRF